MRKEPILSNKYPFVLYFWRDDKAKIVYKEVKGRERVTHVEYAGEKAEIEKMNWVYIFMLKHILPILFFISIFNIEIFSVIHNWLIPLGLILVLLPSFFIFKYKRHLLIFYMTGILMTVYIVATRADYLITEINYSFTFITYLIYLLLLLFDMYMTYRYYVYFYIKNVSSKIDYELGAMRFTLGFWKLKKTFYIKRSKTKIASFKIAGIFLKIPKDKFVIGAEEEQGDDEDS